MCAYEKSFIIVMVINVMTVIDCTMVNHHYHHHRENHGKNENERFGY